MPGFHGSPVNESNYNYDFDYRFYDYDYVSVSRNISSENNHGYLTLYCTIF